MPRKVRIELLVPTHYNPDENGYRKVIEDRKHRLVKNYIIKKFGGITIHPELLEGVWVNPKTKKRNYDICNKLEVCIKHKPTLEKELKQWKEKLKNLFSQVEIFMVHYNVIVV
ncbi:MAG: hypothetical protein V1734_01060 [Nanoarchaeota archaeon]